MESFITRHAKGANRTSGFCRAESLISLLTVLPLAVAMHFAVLKAKERADKDGAHMLTAIASYVGYGMAGLSVLGMTAFFIADCIAVRREKLGHANREKIRPL